MARSNPPICHLPFGKAVVLLQLPGFVEIAAVQLVAAVHVLAKFRRSNFFGRAGHSGCRDL